MSRKSKFNADALPSARKKLAHAIIRAKQEFEEETGTALSNIDVLITSQVRDKEASSTVSALSVTAKVVVDYDVLTISV